MIELGDEHGQTLHVLVDRELDLGHVGNIVGFDESFIDDLERTRFLELEHRKTVTARKVFVYESVSRRSIVNEGIRTNFIILIIYST